MTLLVDYNTLMIPLTNDYSTISLQSKRNQYIWLMLLIDHKTLMLQSNSKKYVSDAADMAKKP